MEALARELYLDLLIKILTNMIYGDPWTNLTLPIPINARPFQPELRTEGRDDWPTIAHTMVGVRRLENVRELAQRAVDEAIPGDFIETGVWRGGCCILMRGVLAANGIKDRKVYVADSFDGLPPPKPEIFPDDRGMDAIGGLVGGGQGQFFPLRIARRSGRLRKGPLSRHARVFGRRPFRPAAARRRSIRIHLCGAGGFVSEGFARGICHPR